MPHSREQLVKAPAHCVDQTVQIYFDVDSAELTREGRLVIHQAAGAAAGCRVASVEVIGLADAQGAPDANLELSKRRAAAVAAVLQAPAGSRVQGRGGRPGRVGDGARQGRAAAPPGRHHPASRAKGLTRRAIGAAITAAPHTRSPSCSCASLGSP